MYLHIDNTFCSNRKKLPGLNFVDFSRLIVYNSLVYVLMEFRGHT